MSIYPLTLVERLELLVFMKSLALSCGLLVLIRAQEGKPGLASNTTKPYTTGR